MVFTVRGVGEADGKAFALHGMPVHVVVGSGDHLSRHAEAVATLVPRDRVGTETEERGKRQGNPANSEAEPLRNRVGVDAMKCRVMG